MTSNIHPKPLEFRKVGEEELFTEWDDGHRSLLSARLLRLNCPCANCVDEWTGQRTIKEEALPARLGVTDWKPVGHYGVRFTWSDGHDTGIFSFTRLRKLCRCPSCLLLK